MRQRMRAHGEGLRPGARRVAAAPRPAPLRRLRRARGRALIVIVAIAVSSTHGRRRREVQLREGETTTLGAYTLTFLRREQVQRAAPRGAGGARRRSARDGRDLGVLEPAHEPVRDASASRSARPRCARSLFEDLYLSVMNIDPAAGTLGLLAMVNPMVGWIWVATAVMALGGLVALVPARRAAQRPRRPSAAPAGGARRVASVRRQLAGSRRLNRRVAARRPRGRAAAPGGPAHEPRPRPARGRARRSSDAPRPPSRCAPVGGGAPVTLASRCAAGPWSSTSGPPGACPASRSTRCSWAAARRSARRRSSWASSTRTSEERVASFLRAAGQRLPVAPRPRRQDRDRLRHLRRAGDVLHRRRGPDRRQVRRAARRRRRWRDELAQAGVAP